MYREIENDRRRFLRDSAMAFAAIEFSGIGSLFAQATEKDSQQESGINHSSTQIKQIDAGLLDVGYRDIGPENGSAVILLHGWPYDIQSFADVAPLLASAGYRVIVPYLRGYSTTRFLSIETFRNGQPSALAVDVIDLMDALKIQKAIFAGFDWGARTAD